MHVAGRKRFSQGTSHGAGLSCPEEAAFLELLRTTGMLSRGLVKVLKIEDPSTTQYNVL
jgi:hypothetical protein